MIKRLGTTGLVLGLTLAATTFAPAAAAECGLAGLLAPCPGPSPSPQPLPLPLPVPPAVDLTPVLPALPAAPELVPTPAPAPPAPVPTSTTGSRTPQIGAADRLLQLVNEARAGAGLPALTVNARAVSIAAGHTMAMAERGDIFHNPAYLTAATRSSLGARALGENVAMNGSIEGAHQRLLASPGHRANILNGAFDAVGIAVVSAGGTLFLTQDFLDSAGTAASAPVAKPAVAPKAPRPAAVYQAASTPPVAAAVAAPAAPDAVLSAGDPVTEPSVAVAVTAVPPVPGGRPGLVPVAALTLLVSIAGAGIRLFVLRA